MTYWRSVQRVALFSPRGRLAHEMIKVIGKGGSFWRNWAPRSWVKLQVTLKSIT